ncbi:hypothetical protein LMG28138_05118 [Pararobbsia alpina]|uniref:Uncharacterized protein n=1 Tax=Pararobbsia alpina TaxID=621374 RepID=A0A6S7BJ40_9BURK|nr:hypothetical protein LMG28138_05118 [Pararobbsia alpina]
METILDTLRGIFSKVCAEVDGEDDVHLADGLSAEGFRVRTGEQPERCVESDDWQEELSERPTQAGAAVHSCQPGQDLSRGEFTL